MARIRTLIVDDSVVVRRLIQDALATDPDIAVIDTAVNGKKGVEKAKALRPDIITMDIEMPEMNGIEAVAAIRAAGIKCPIIMFSTLTAAGAKATLDALQAGASEFVTKPGNVGHISESMESVRNEVIPKIKALTRGSGYSAVSDAARPGRPRPTERNAAPAASPGDEKRVSLPRQERRTIGLPRALLIGASTGGPQALTELLGSMPPRLGVPIYLVQHMPPMFTAQLAERLNKVSHLNVVEACDGQLAENDTVYIAPGDYHMTVHKKGPRQVISLNQQPAENFCRPAVDPLFRSYAESFGGNAIVCMLTGMGQDGCKATDQIRRAGAYVVAQDEATSIVWGMPGAVVKANLHDAVLPLKDIAPHITQRLHVTKSPSGDKATSTEVS